MAKKTEVESWTTTITKKITSTLLAIGAAIALFFFGVQSGESNQGIKMTKEIMDINYKHNLEIMDLKTQINLQEITIKTNEINEKIKNNIKK